MPPDYDDVTPPPVNPAVEAWREARAVAREYRELERRVGEQLRALDERLGAVEHERTREHVHLFGLAGQDPGRLGRLEATVKTHDEKIVTHDRALNRLDRITWKIFAAAGLAGATVALILGLIDRIAKWGS